MGINNFFLFNFEKIKLPCIFLHSITYFWEPEENEIYLSQGSIKPVFQVEVSVFKISFCYFSSFLFLLPHTMQLSWLNPWAKTSHVMFFLPVAVDVFLCPACYNLPVFICFIKAPIFLFKCKQILKLIWKHFKIKLYRFLW